MSTLLGRPITGKINYYTENPSEQKPIQEFLDALDQLLSVEHVSAVKWNQYTPYFNDGEACQFSIYEANISLDFQTDLSTEMSDADEDFEDKFYTEYDFYEYPNGYDRTKEDGGKVFYVINGVDFKSLHHELEKFNSILVSGAHYIDLLKHFGDPAEVTATKEGFSVEFYDHE